MIQLKEHLIKIHIAVFLFGVSGLFAKFLTLDASTIVMGRTFFGSLALVAVMAARKEPLLPELRKDFPLFFLGGLLAGHWYSFFHAIQVSTVSIGLLTFSSFPVFVAILEPVFIPTRLSFTDIVSSGIVVLGIALIVPQFDLGDKNTVGCLWGILSGFTFAILQILNRRLVRNRSALHISLYENASACLLLFAVSGAQVESISIHQLGGLLMLGVFCTALAHTLFISGLSSVRAQVASIIAGLEPVYGIVLAALLLGEIPSLRTIVGGGLILGAVMWVGSSNQDRPEPAST